MQAVLYVGYISIYIEGKEICSLLDCLTRSRYNRVCKGNDAESAITNHRRKEEEKMVELKNELYAVPEYEWQIVPITANRHKWLLRWYREDGDGEFFFEFISPAKRRYSFFTERGAGGGRLTYADVASANGYTIANSWEVTGDKMDAAIRLTPQHILDRLQLLLDAIR